MHKLVLGLVLTLTVPGGKSVQTIPADAPRNAPEFDLALLSGGRLKSSDLKGKIVILDFWATWCVACVQDTPELNAIYDKYKSDGVQLIGIAVQSGDADTIKAKAQELKMRYPVAIADDSIEKAFGGSDGLVGLPITYVLGKDWKMGHIYLGATPFKRPSIEKEIDAMLKHPGAD